MKARHSVSCTLSPTHLLEADVLQETLRGAAERGAAKAEVSKRSTCDPAALQRGWVKDLLQSPTTRRPARRRGVVAGRQLARVGLSFRLQTG